MQNTHDYPIDKTSCFVPIKIILINERDAFFENKTTCFVPKPIPPSCEDAAFNEEYVRQRRSEVDALFND